MSWIFEGINITSLNTIPKKYKDYFGFIYCIVFEDGTEYYGRKNFYTCRTKTVSQKRVREKGKSFFRRKKIKKGKNAGEWKYYEIDKKESNWLSYTSSSSKVKEKVKNGINFTKYIIEFVEHENMMNYKEAKHQFCSSVLEHEKFLNDNILGRFHKKNILKR